MRRLIALAALAALLVPLAAGGARGNPKYTVELLSVTPGSPQGVVELRVTYAANKPNVFRFAQTVTSCTFLNDTVPPTPLTWQVVGDAGWAGQQPITLRAYWYDFPGAEDCEAYVYDTFRGDSERPASNVVTFSG